MALLFYDSFDTYGNTTNLLRQWPQAGGGGSGVIAAAGRRSTSALRIEPPKGSRLTLPSTYSHLIVGFSYNPETIPGRLPIFNFESSATVATSLVQEADGKLSLVQGAWNGGGTSLTVAGGVGVIVAGSTRHIQIDLSVHNSTGAWSLIIDGTNVLASGSGVDTQYLSYTTISSVSFGLGPNYFSPNQFNIDDFYICDGTGPAPYNAPLGDCRVDTFIPTGDGFHTGLTPSTGSDHYPNVDDSTPDDDSTYNSSASGTDTYTFPAWGFTPTDVLAVGVKHTSKYNDSAMNSAAVTRVDGTDYTGSTIPLASSYLPYLSFWTENPDTSAPWTKSDAEGAEFGITVS